MTIIKVKQLALKLLDDTYKFTVAEEFADDTNDDYTLTSSSDSVKGKTYSISPANDLMFKFRFSDAKTIFGTCDSHGGIISLSKPLCLLNLDMLDTEIKDTILHEIAHALCDHVHGHRVNAHGKEWKSIAKQIGCRPSRCYEESVNGVKPKYTLTCPSCFEVYHQHRLHRRRSISSCGKCDKNYNPKYKLMVKKNF